MNLSDERAPMDVNEAAVVALSLAQPDPTSRGWVDRWLTAPTRDWRRFWRCARHNAVISWVAIALERGGWWERIPGELQRRLAAERDRIAAANDARATVAARLFAACRQAGIRVVVLKGALFAEEIYCARGYKKMNDVDLLVRFADIAALRGIYRALGLVPLALLEGGADEVDEAKTHHLPAYVSKDLSFVVGTHWALASRKSGYRLDHEAMWARVRPATVAGEAVWALAPADNLHHLVVHFHYYKTGLKELADFANLIRASASSDQIDWNAFGETLAVTGTCTPGYRSLRLLDAVYAPVVGSLVPASVLERCRRAADPWVVTDTDRVVARPDLLLWSRSTWSSEIEKAYLTFQYEDGLVAKARAWIDFWHKLLLPPRRVIWRTNACAPGERSLPWLYAVNLWRTAREVGQGFGMAVFGLLMLKSAWDLACAAIPGRMTAMKTGPMAELRAALGGDEARIRRLLASME